MSMNSEPTILHEYPLVFTQGYDIVTDAVAARVVVRGRALMAYEDDQWWCHGVEPGGLTAPGDDPTLAFAAFKDALYLILGELAEEAGNAENFAKAVRDFIDDGDANEATRWQTARDAIRAGANVDEPFTDMKRVTDTPEVGVTVNALVMSPEESDVRLAGSIAA